MTAYYPGGIISATEKTTSVTSASGVWAMTTQTQKTRGNQWPFVTASLDPTFNQTQLLIHADGINRANNTVFIDGSNISSFIPFPNTYSTFFNGSTDRLLIANNQAGYQFGGGDFTVEFYVYSTSSATPQRIVNNWSSSTGTAASWEILTGSNPGSVQFNCSTAGTAVSVQTSGTMSLNTWNHIAAVRNGNVFSLYINGSLAQSNTQAITLQTADTFSIGSRNNAGSYIEYFAGYLNNLRITKGNARYTSNFTPPTTNLTADANTTLLTLQSPFIVDSGSNNYYISTVGTPVQSSGWLPTTISNKPAQGAFSPFTQTGWSSYHNGSTSYINMAADGLNTPGTQDFTFEFWMNSPIVNNGISIVASHQIGGMFAIGSNAGGTISAVYNQDGGATDTKVGPISGVSLVNNTWNHIAVSRNGTALRLFINGTLSNTYTFAAGTNVGSYGGAKPFYLGAGSDLGSSYTGYLSNIRYVVGTALYTSNFTPPTTAPAIVPGTRFIMSSTGSGLTVDASRQYTSAITVGGTPTIVAFPPYAPNTTYSSSLGSSAWFNGSSDNLNIQTTYSLPSASTPFSVECWVYPQTQLSGTGIVSAAYPGSGAIPFSIIGSSSLGGTTGSNLAAGWYSGSAWSGVQSSTSLVLNQWSHIAFVYNGYSGTLYLNGVNIGTYTGPWTTQAIQSTFYIGRRWDATGTPFFNGFISNFRYLINSILYTSNFIPPTAPQPPTGASIFHQSFNNAGIYDFAGKHNLATYGSVVNLGGGQISNVQNKFGGSSLYFDGTSTSYITAASATGTYASLNGNFTVEFWVYMNNITGTQIFFDTRPSGTASTSNQMVIQAASGIVSYLTAGVTAITGTITLVAGTWNHIAVCRSAGATRLFVNGTQSGSTYVDTQTYSFGTNRPVLGCDGNSLGSSPLNGYMDEIRVSRVARYTANSTPSTAPFANQ